jgi:hypothetical protein
MQGLPATLIAVTIALATVAITLFVTCHPCCHCHCSFCCHYCCLPATLINVTIALFDTITIHSPAILVAIATALPPLHS